MTLSSKQFAAMMSSATDDWSTPQDFFDAMCLLYDFTLDTCATADNAKCAHYFSKEQDGLTQQWEGVCWMNPPYGRQIKLWVAKARRSAQQGATVVCLLPARVDTAWWHDYCEKGDYWFVRGRLCFSGKDNAPFPCAVVEFSPSTLK